METPPKLTLAQQAKARATTYATPGSHLIVRLLQPIGELSAGHKLVITCVGTRFMPGVGVTGMESGQFYKYVETMDDFHTLFAYDVAEAPKVLALFAPSMDKQSDLPL